ncbi:DUF397 domain-containing protein [Streptomyces sp. NPDC002523]
MDAASWQKSSYSNTDGGACVEVSGDFLDAASWQKSSYSNSDGGNCVEVGHDTPSVVPVRDSKDPARGALVFPVGSWAAFVGGVVKREGAF